MEKNYYIIGSGGFAKEVYFLAEEILGEKYIFNGFIDKNPTVLTGTVRGKEEKVLDEDTFLKTINPSKNIELYIGIGDPKLLSRLDEEYNQFNFPNLISPTAVFDRQSVKMGRGNIITAGCIFTVDINIGSFNVFNLGTTVGHDTHIGSYNIFNPGSNVSGGVKIQSLNLFGTNCTILQNLQIGSRNVLGASSLANRSFGNDSVMVGVPAKNLKK